MEKKISICFSTILGNFSIENENKQNITAYNDFFAKLYKTNFPISMHLTGSFLQMIQSKDQAFYDIIKELLDRKQIELIGGAFFSPLFPIISSTDLVGQIDMYVTAIRKFFSVRPKYAYVPFSAWNSSVVPALKKTGIIDYCLLDHQLFLKHNLSPFMPACLEDAGKVITAIPYIYKKEIDKTPEEFYTDIIENANIKEGFNIVVIFLQHAVFSKLLTKTDTRDSWMESFKKIVCQHKNTELSTIAKSLKDESFFPSGFMEPNIVLDGKLQNVSVKKIISQNTVSYDMYKKIMYVSVLANQIRGDKQRKLSATQQMWKSQNAIFFLNSDSNLIKNRNLIYAFYKNLLLAEKIARDQQFNDSFVPYDFNLDGTDEYISQTKNINTYVNLKGGKIFEYDFLPSNKNFCVLPIQNSAMFVDYFFSKNEIENIYNIEPKFSLKDNHYQLLKYCAQKKTLQLKVTSNYNNTNISVKKNYSFNGNFINVQYILKNESQINFSSFFGTSFDIAIGKRGKNISSIVTYSQNKKEETLIENFHCDELSWIQINDAESRARISLNVNEKVNLAVIPFKDPDENIIGLRLYFYWKVILGESGESEKLFTMQTERLK